MSAPASPLPSDYPSYQKNSPLERRKRECEDANLSSLKFNTLIGAVLMALAIAALALQSMKDGNSTPNPMGLVAMGTSSAIVVDIHNSNSNKRISNAERKIHILETLQALQRSIAGTVYFQDSTNFDKAAHVWSVGAVHTNPPWAVIEVQNEADVQIAVPVLVFLKQTYNFPFRIRSGGHNKAAYSTVAEGAILSLVRMNQIELLPFPPDDQPVVRMGPAVLVEQFALELLEKQGLGGVIGFCGKVAEAGFVLGGGLGVQSRTYGLGADNVKSLRIVLVDGSVHHASMDTEQDLFWALRGAGGGSFGVVTEIDYHIHKASNRWIITQVRFDEPNAMATFLYRLGKEEPHLPGNVLVMHDEPKTANLVYSGRDESEMAAGPKLLDNLLQRLIPQDSSFNVTNADLKWSDSYHAQFSSWGIETWAAGCWYGFMMPENNTHEIWKDIIQHISKGVEESSPYLAPDIELWGGKIRDTRWNETAFPHRSAVFNVGVLLNIPVDLMDAEKVFKEHVAKVNAWWPKVKQYLTGSYVNYPTVSLRNDEYPHVYWGDNLPRLVNIKRRVDPLNSFQFPMSVPMEL
jgi:FAD/FMN-containing dehydrogenase